MTYNSFSKTLSKVLYLIASTSLLLAFFSYLNNNSYFASFLMTSFTTVFLNFIIALFLRNKAIDKSRFTIVSCILFGWIVIFFLCSIPLLLADLDLDFSSVFFETISMATTTGFTVLSEEIKDIIPLLIWRSITQWIGGLYTLFVYLYILDLIILEDKQSILQNLNKALLTNRIFIVYSSATFVCFFSLLLLDNSLLNSFLLALATISSGGISIGDGHVLSSVLYNLNNYIVLLFFMIFSAISVPLVINLNKYSYSLILKNVSLKVFLFVCLFVSVVIFLIGFSNYKELLDIVFISISMLTTSGYLPNNIMLDEGQHLYENLTFLFVSFTLVGGLSGSVTGGFKVTRILSIWEAIKRETSKLFFIHEVKSRRFLKSYSSSESINSIFGLFVLGIMIIVLSISLLSLLGLNFTESFYLSLAALTNSGDGVLKLANISISNNIAVYSILSIVMILGRFESICVLLLLSKIIFKGRY